MENWMNRMAEYDNRMNVDGFDLNDDYSDEDCYDDEFENMMSECGKIQDGTCMLAGTEHCDWDCPFSK